MMSRIEAADALLAVQKELGKLIQRARGILAPFREEYNRADAYCLAEIEIALGDDHGYAGSSGYSIEDAIRDLREEPTED